MGFKDEIAKDTQRVFINPLEFADKHNFNGAVIDCVVDDDAYQQRSNNGQASNSQWAEGVFLDVRTVFIKKGLLPAMPVTGQRVTLDGEFYIVKAARDDMGLLTIELVQNDF